MIIQKQKCCTRLHKKVIGRQNSPILVAFPIKKQWFTKKKQWYCNIAYMNISVLFKAIDPNFFFVLWYSHFHATGTSHGSWYHPESQEYFTLTQSWSVRNTSLSLEDVPDSRNEVPESQDFCNTEPNIFRTIYRNF